MIDNAFGEVLTWHDLVYNMTLNYVVYHVLLYLKGDLCFSKCRTIKDLHVWLLKHHGSFYSPLINVSYVAKYLLFFWVTNHL